jgi:hypothetical protein
MSTTNYPVEIVPLDSLKAHPRNYRTHPADQIAHLQKSIKDNGQYRNIVIAQDGTILAGHGVAQAMREMGKTEVAVYRLNIQPTDPRALKVLAGDNEIAHLGEINDRALSELLREVKEVDIDGLIGTGYDEMMLANLVFVSRAEGEIKDHNEAAHWVGLPDYDPGQRPEKMIVSFESEADRQDFARRLGITLTEKMKSMWWPMKDKEDISSLRVEG